MTAYQPLDQIADVHKRSPLIRSMLREQAMLVSGLLSTLDERDREHFLDRDPAKILHCVATNNLTNVLASSYISKESGVEIFYTTDSLGDPSLSTFPTRPSV